MMRRNNLEYYAYIINHAIPNGCDFSVTDEVAFGLAVEQQSASLQTKVCTAVTTEKIFIDTVDYKQYQLFCEKTICVYALERQSSLGGDFGFSRSSASTTTHFARYLKAKSTVLFRIV